MDTIFAMATAPGKAGVAVIRLSGPQAWAAGCQLAGQLPPARKSALRRLTSPLGEPLDDALVLCFERGASFTGEEVVEFHLHGSPAITAAVLRELAGLPNFRLAEPGEFTRQALENGCLDLAQVEGLADLIESETESQRKQAMRVFNGALGKKVEFWRKDLIRAVSLLEATIDFADEDVPVDVGPEVLELIDSVVASLSAESAGSLVSERIRAGFEVAIVGRPNVGKSTLLNQLAGRDAALTSEIAGTTRDVIEVRMDLDGLPVTFLDTAGIRQSSDEIENLGVNRAVQRAKAADLRVFLILEKSDIALGLAPASGDIVVYGMSDKFNYTNALAVSGKTGAGVSDMVDALTNTLRLRASGAGSAIRERHRIAVDQAIIFLQSARDIIASNTETTELASEELHQAIRSLDSLIGRVDVENILDEIFASFCIGK